MEKLKDMSENQKEKNHKIEELAGKNQQVLITQGETIKQNQIEEKEKFQEILRSSLKEEMI